MKSLTPMRTTLLLGLFAFALTVGLINHAGATPGHNKGDGKVTILPGNVHGVYNGLVVGTGGSRMMLVKTGQIKVSSGHTSKTLTLANVSVGDLAFITPAASLGSAAWGYAICTTDSLQVVLNANPAATATLNYVIIGQP